MRTPSLGLSLSCAFLGVATGCTNYQPIPLDLPSHESQWRDLAPAQGFTLTPAEAEAFALCANPHLRTLRAGAGVAMAGKTLAGLWDDPNFSLGLSRRTAGGANPWLVEGGIGFSIPLSGRLEVQKKLAQQQLDEVQASLLVAESTLLRELRLALVEHRIAGRKCRLLAAHAKNSARLAERAEQILAAGELSRLEAGALALTAAEATAEAAAAETEFNHAKLRLVELLGLRPEAPLVVTGETAPWQAPTEPQARLDQHPRLLQVKAEYAAAEAAYELEVCKQRPDLDIGPTVKWENGQSNLGFGLGLPIPAWNRNRLAIARAEAHRNAVKAAAEEVHQNLRHALAQADDKYASSQARIRQLKTLVPRLAAWDQQLQSLLASGEGDPLRLGDVLQRRRNSSLSLLEAEYDAAVAVIELRSLLQAVPSPER